MNRYPVTIKRQAKRLLNQGKKPKYITQKLGISRHILYYWRKPEVIKAINKRWQEEWPEKWAKIQLVASKKAKKRHRERMASDPLYREKKRKQYYKAYLRRRARLKALRIAQSGKRAPKSKTSSLITLVL